MDRQEQIQDASKKWVAGWQSKQEAVMTQTAFIKGAEWSDANRWVRVEDGLPEVGRECVVLNSGYVFIDKVRNFKSGPSFLSKGVTHWMPIPEPPKPSK